MKHIIGFCGKMRTGKDTGCRLLGLERVAFADELKKEVKDFLLEQYNIDVFKCTNEQKEIIRSILVGHGEARRKQNPDYWINKVIDEIEDYDEGALIGITDMRYLNEVLTIGEFAEDIPEEYKVTIFRIHRPNYELSNETEERTFKEIDDYFADDKNLKAFGVYARYLIVNNNTTLGNYLDKLICLM